ncbi:MAG: hypothetical protein WC101_02395 [Candidatus Gracilibacteria bacterium]
MLYHGARAAFEVCGVAQKELFPPKPADYSSKIRVSKDENKANYSALNGKWQPSGFRLRDRTSRRTRCRIGSAIGANSMPVIFWNMLRRVNAGDASRAGGLKECKKKSKLMEKEG